LPSKKGELFKRVGCPAKMVKFVKGVDCLVNQSINLYLYQVKNPYDLSLKE